MTAFKTPLDNVGAAINRNAGGPSRPFSFRVARIFGHMKENNNTIVDAWGFRLARQVKNDNSNTVVSNDIIAEVADNGGVGPRDYANTSNQRFNLDLTAEPNNTLAAEEVLVFGVEAPTAITTNRYIQFQTGWIECFRV